MKTIEYKFQELCEEIDYWRERAEHFEQKYNEEIEESIERTNKDLERTKKGVADALMFALSVKDNEDGSLTISNEDRKELAKRYEL